VLDPAALWVLMRNGGEAHERNGPHIYYQLYLPYVCDGDPAAFAARSHDTADSSTAGDWITPQRAGTCYYRCALAAMRFYVRLRGMDKEECKRLTLYIRVCYMLMVKDDLRCRLEGSGAHVTKGAGLGLHASDYDLIRMGCK